jgi:hypothetical protein
MIVRVELYYEIVAKNGEKIPQEIKTLLVGKVMNESSNTIPLKSSFWNGDQLTARLLSSDEIHERIRTAK